MAPVIFTLIVVCFYIPFLFVIRRSLDKNTARKRFFRSVFSIIASSNDESEAISRIKTSFNKTKEIFGKAMDDYRTYGDLIEELLFRVNAYTDIEFKRHWGLQVTEETKLHIARLVEAYRSAEPFSSVSSKFGSLLLLCQKAYDSSSPTVGKESLAHLALEVQAAEKRIRSLDRLNTFSAIVSIVGVVLTLVFGVISLLPLFR